MDRKRKKRSVALPLLILITALTAVGIAGYILYERNEEYAAGDRAYAELEAFVAMPKQEQDRAWLEPILEKPTDTETATAGEDGYADVYIEPIYVPELEIDFDALEEMNKDVIGWLYSPETVINYPVMRAKDYRQYLNTLPNGKRNKNGSLFLDYHCGAEFRDRLSIIYGHHMKSGKMFASLVSYKKQGYYEEHPYMYLYTRKGTYRVELAYGCVLGARDLQEQAYIDGDVEKLLTFARETSTFSSGVELKEQDRILVLSTCSYEYDDARYIVVGRLRRAR